MAEIMSVEEALAVLAAYRMAQAAVDTVRSTRLLEEQQRLTGTHDI